LAGSRGSDRARRRTGNVRKADPRWR
jgi:hypothetical protein